LRYQKPQWDANSVWHIERLYTHMGACHGRIPRGMPPTLAQWREIVTKTQKIKPISNCNTLLNHVLPLARV
jgi:hypothetical protein